jgi:hypothetical protein
VCVVTLSLAGVVSAFYVACQVAYSAQQAGLVSQDRSQTSADVDSRWMRLLETWAQLLSVWDAIHVKVCACMCSSCCGR